MSLNSLKCDNSFQIECLQEKIDHTQRYMLTLSQNMMKLAHKTSKVRDIGDEMVQTLLDFCIKDTSNPAFIQNLKQFSYCLSAVEDHRDSNIERINSEIINQFNQFNESIKFTKTELRTIIELHNRGDQTKKKNFMNFINKNSSSSKNSILTNSDNEIAISKEKIMNDKINCEIEKFEKEKAKFIQEILKTFTLTQLSFYSQAVQLYTNAYKCLINKKPEMDIKNEICKIGRNLYSSNLEMDEERLTKTLNDSKNLNIDKSSYLKYTTTTNGCYTTVARTSSIPKKFANQITYFNHNQNNNKNNFDDSNCNSSLSSSSSFSSSIIVPKYNQSMNNDSTLNYLPTNSINSRLTINNSTSIDENNKKRPTITTTTTTTGTSSTLTPTPPRLLVSSSFKSVKQSSPVSQRDRSNKTNRLSVRTSPRNKSSHHFDDQTNTTRANKLNKSGSLSLNETRI